MNSKKVFCLGWHKTGTSTMGLALIELGYKVVGARLDTVDDLNAGRIAKILELAEQFDAFQDVPWAALYRELDEAFPGSRFILVERDESKWLQSASTHFGDQHIPLHEWLYGEGVMDGHEDLYLERYRRHNDEVKAYFANREDFLNFSIQHGDGWDKLCRFLNKPVPKLPFPHENKGQHSYNRRDKALKAIKAIIPARLRRTLFGVRLFFRKARGLPDPRDRFHNFEANRRSRSVQKSE